MRDVRLYVGWVVAGMSLLTAVAVIVGQWPPFAATAQEPKAFQYKIIEVLPDTQNMQTRLNEFGAAGWELVAVSMGEMTEPRLIFKK
jgi:hypothetical protein